MLAIADTAVLINESAEWDDGPGERRETEHKSIGSNIRILHLVHVHLHWLASRPTFISFFLDQSAAPASGKRFRTHVPPCPSIFFSFQGHRIEWVKVVCRQLNLFGWFQTSFW